MDKGTRSVTVHHVNDYVRQNAMSGKYCSTAMFSIKDPIYMHANVQRAFQFKTRMGHYTLSTPIADTFAICEKVDIIHN